MDRRFTYLATIITISIMLFAITATANSNNSHRRHAGEITVLLIDSLDLQSAQTVYQLSITGEDSPFHLEFPGAPPFALRTGQRVSVMARELPGRRLGVKEVTLLKVNPNGDKAASGSKDSNKGGGGKKSDSSHASAVILINLLDADSLLTPMEAEDMMWAATDSTRDIYHQDSRGMIDFAQDSDNDDLPDVYGPYDVAMTGAGSCDYHGWSNTARAQAISDGINLNNRSHYIYVLTGHNNNGCSFGGVAELGGDEVWINLADVFVFVHELGHNLDLNHAGSDPDNDGRNNNAYGDGSSFMGASYRNIFLNAPQNEAMGFLKARDGAIVGVPTKPGLYNYILEPLSWDVDQTFDPQILKIMRNDLDRIYYLSLRDASIYDANLHSSYQSGVSIHWYKPDAPGTVTGYVTTLTDGESFVDGINGITVTQNARASDGSWVDINVQIEPVYDTATPGLDISGLHQQFAVNTVGPNELAQYAITLTNNDAPGTPPSTWTFSTRNIPSGMLASFDQASVTLAPGESVTSLLSVDPNGAADGFSVFYIDATDADAIAPHHLVVNDYAQLVVDSVSLKPQPPTGLSGSSRTSKGKLYFDLSWSASPSSDVALYRIHIDEGDSSRYWRTSTSTALSLRWTENPGTYTFMVVAENNAGKISVESQPLTVTIGKTRTK